MHCSVSNCMLLGSMLNDQSHPEFQLHGEVQQFLHAAVHDLRAAQRRTAIATELLLQSSSDQERSDLAAQVLQGLSRTEELLTGIASYANALTPSRLGTALPACSRLFVEPGQALSTPAEALIATVVEVRERAARCEVVIDAGYPDWPQMHAYPHPIFAAPDGRWRLEKRLAAGLYNKWRLTWPPITERSPRIWEFRSGFPRARSAPSRWSSRTGSPGLS